MNISAYYNNNSYKGNLSNKLKPTTIIQYNELNYPTSVVVNCQINSNKQQLYSVTTQTIPY